MSEFVRGITKNHFTLIAYNCGQLEPWLKDLHTNDRLNLVELSFSLYSGDYNMKDLSLYIYL